MRVGSLFSGIGGIELGLARAFGSDTQFVWQVEVEPWAALCLQKNFAGTPNLGDITKVDWEGVRESDPVDALCGGFPCQDISQAGKGLGIEHGARSGLWANYFEAVRALRPRYVFVENVSALLGRGLDRVLGDLASIGYDARWDSIRASDFGAPHERERILIVAADSRRVAAERRPEPRELGPTPGASLGEGLQLERGGRTARDRSEAPAADAGGQRRESWARLREERAAGGGQQDRLGHADRDGGAHERPAFQHERVGGRAVEQGAPSPDSPDAHRERRRRKPARNRPGWVQEQSQWDDADRRSDDVDWGEYRAAVERWEALQGPAPRPTDPAGRLNPAFVEWMMGFPAGWTGMLPRREALRCLGNAVVPHVAQHFLVLLDDLERAAVAA